MSLSVTLHHNFTPCAWTLLCHFVLLFKLYEELPCMSSSANFSQKIILLRPIMLTHAPVSLRMNKENNPH